MKIGIDLDGTSADFHGASRYMLHAYRGVEMPPVDEFWTSWDAQYAYGTKEDHQWLHTEGVKQGLYRYCHVIKGTYVALNKMKDMGHSLEVITHRPENAVADTIAWLALLNFSWSGVHILSHGESKTSVKVDALVDDKASNVDAFANIGRKGVLFSRPWNRDYAPEHWKQVYRAEGWEEVTRIVGEW